MLITSSVTQGDDRMLIVNCLSFIVVRRHTVLFFQCSLYPFTFIYHCIYFYYIYRNLARLPKFLDVIIVNEFAIYSFVAFLPKLKWKEKHNTPLFCSNEHNFEKKIGQFCIICYFY